jgi:cytochrome c oxidase subunit 3
MSTAVPKGQAPYYFVPGPSRHPVMAAIGLFFVILGAGQWVNGAVWGAYSLAFGLLWWAVVLKQWFGDAIRESESGLYSQRIDVSYRWAMAWFIFSEVMFFAAFFGALYWARMHALPNLGSIDNALLWPDFKAIWPSTAPGFTGSPAGTVEAFRTMGPLAAAHHQHRLAADLGRHPHHRAPRLVGEPARQNRGLHVAHRLPGRLVSVPARL